MHVERCTQGDENVCACGIIERMDHGSVTPTRVLKLIRDGSGLDHQAIDEGRALGNQPVQCCLSDVFLMVDEVFAAEDPLLALSAKEKSCSIFVN